jgi:hypothetical protein
MKKNSTTYTNDYFIGKDKLKGLRNPDTIKHFRTIKEMKALGSPNSSPVTDEKPYIFSLNVLNDRHGDGILYSFGKLNDDGKKMDIDFFYRYDDPATIETSFYEIFSLLKEVKRDSLICTFSEKANVGDSLIKLLLDIDDGVKYNDEKIDEQFLKLEKNILIKGESIFEIVVGQYNVKLLSRIGATTEFSFNYTGKKKMKRDINIKIFDLAPFYKEGLKKTVEENKFKYPINEKVDEVNFEKFQKQYNKKLNLNEWRKQNEYVKNVFEKLGLQSYGTWALANSLVTMFYKTYGKYPKSLYSIGNLTEQALATEISRDDREKLLFHSFIEDLKTNNELNDVMKLLHFSVESYNAGLIEQNYHGFVSEGLYADITSSYPYVMANGLYDLEGAKIEYFEAGYYKKLKELKPKKGEYVLIRAYIHSNEKNGESHSIIVKKDDIYSGEELETKLNSPVKMKKFDAKNVNPRGFMTVCETYEALKFFEDGKGNEIIEIYEVVRIQTLGKKHPLATIARKWFNNRMKDKENDFIKKIILNAVYGKTYEGYPLFEAYEGKDGKEKIEFTGLKVGSYFNPLLATIITSFARIRISEVVRTAERNEGRVIMVQTDSIHVTISEKKLKATNTEKEKTKALQETFKKLGTDIGENVWYKQYGMPSYYITGNDLWLDDIIPARFDSVLTENYGMVNGWSEKKEFGMLSKPERFTDGFFLTIGVYEMRIKGKMETKNMGFPLAQEDTSEKGLLTGWYRNKYFDSTMNQNTLKGTSIEYYDGSNGFFISYNERNTIGTVISNKMSYRAIGTTSYPVKYFSMYGIFMGLIKRSVDIENIQLNKHYFQKTIPFTLWEAEKFNEGTQIDGLLESYFELSSVTKEDEEKEVLQKFFDMLPVFNDRKKVYSRILGIPQHSRNKENMNTIEKIRDIGCIKMVIEQGKLMELFI